GRLGAHPGKSLSGRLAAAGGLAQGHPSAAPRNETRVTRAAGEVGVAVSSGDRSAKWHRPTSIRSAAGELAAMPSAIWRDDRQAPKDKARRPEWLLHLFETRRAGSAADKSRRTAAPARLAHE